MFRFNAYDELAKISPAELARVAMQLNSSGFATDEDGLCLGSMLIEHWCSRCTALLNVHGYESGELGVTAKFFPQLGAIYVLYDIERRSFVDAVSELHRVAERAALHL